ncbi:MAG: hypothetical protein HOP11_02315 [Saprospiraceae bacterium]|nr:hypothetical protein [Saprospiraceae bacterium]
MKNILFLIFIASILSVQCKSKEENKGPKIQKEDQSGPEYTSAYICPMHCKGSGSDKPGTCPVCGMDYEKKEN